MLSSTDIQQGQRTTRGSGRYATNAIVGDQFKEVDTTNVDGAWFTRLLQHGLTGFTPFYTIAQGPYGGGGRRFQCICKHAGIAYITIVNMGYYGL